MVTKAFLVLICCDDRCNLRPGRKPDQHAETGSKWLEDTFVLVTAQVSMAKSVTYGPTVHLRFSKATTCAFQRWPEAVLPSTRESASMAKAAKMWRPVIGQE
jgi:hypothetical protein